MKLERFAVAPLTGAVAIVLGAVSTTASAETFWTNAAWGGSTPSWNTVYDKQSARLWEANPPRGYPTVSKSNIAPMKSAIKRYRDIVKAGGWPRVPNSILKGGGGSAVKLLRRRLEASGDIGKSNGYSGGFTGTLERALRRFQLRHGLTPSGRVNKRTLAALNVPASARLRQLRKNLSRMYSLSSYNPGRYILVNIPAQQVEAVENGRVVSRHSGVVGKIDRPSPLLKSRVHEINFNPMWTLPPTVIKKDLIPKGRKMQRRGKDVLAKFGIDAYSNGRKLDSSKINWSGSLVHNLTYRQPPGKDNPMGFVKINFHNSYSVYMHDTPSGRLFGRNFRAASSGCIRVSRVEDLVAWILRDNSGWSRGRVAQMKRTGARKDVRVKKPVSVRFAYVTAWASKDGFVNFRRDLYRRDGAGRLASAY